MGLLDAHFLQCLLGLAHALRGGVFGLQVLLLPRKLSNLRPELTKLSLQFLERGRLLSKALRVVLELLLVHVLVSLCLFELSFFLGQLLAEGVALILKLFLVLQHCLLLLGNEVGLLLVDRETRILVVFVDLSFQGLDFHLHCLKLVLKLVDVTLGHRWVTKSHVDFLQSLQLFLILTPDAIKLFATLNHLLSQHPEHRLCVALAVRACGLAHLAKLRGLLDVELLRLLKLVALLCEFLHEHRLLLLLLSEVGSDLEEGLKSLVALRLVLELRDLLCKLVLLGAQLAHLPLEVCGVRAAASLLFQVSVGGLELGLELLVLFVHLIDLFFPQELFGDF
mmetsp:Transcript_57174/g.121579  ORF Transcript_57174/g.121579 Transcript_57174/m.121579 type:complete len:337 (-) Transcript_57174:368-1378(-)